MSRAAVEVWDLHRHEWQRLTSPRAGDDGHARLHFLLDVVGDASARIEKPEGALEFTGPIDAAPAPHVRVPAASLPAGDYLVVVVPARRDPATDPPEFTLRVR